MYREFIHSSKRLKVQETNRTVIVYNDTGNPHLRNSRIFANMKEAEKAEGFSSVDLKRIGYRSGGNENLRERD